MKHPLFVLIPALLAGACASGPGPVVPESETERKMIGLLQKFDLWDDNGDSELDRDELAAGLEGSGHDPDRTIDFYDTNRNRRISLREAQAGYNRSAEAEQRIKAREAAGR